MKKIIGIIIIGVFISSNLFAQGWCSGGLLITNKGDTIRGDIKYEVFSLNYREVSILTEDGVKLFYPHQIKSFSYLDKINFNRRTFVSGILSTLFVEEIIVSHISLYKQSYDFIVKKDDVVYQLDVGFETIRIEDRYYKKEKTKWKGILIFLMSDEISNITKRMRTFKMTDKSINDLVVEYNNLKNELITNNNDNVPWHKFNVGVSAGVGLSTLALRTTSISSTPFYDSYTPTISPSFGITANLLNPRRNLAINTGVYYSSVNYYAYATNETYYGYTLFISDINLTTLTVPFTVRKHLGNNKLSFFIDAGLLFDFHLLTESVLYEEEVNRNVVDILKNSDEFGVAKSQFGYMLDFGFLIKKNSREVGLSLQYDEMFLFPEMFQLSGKCRTLSLNMLYYF